MKTVSSWRISDPVLPDSGQIDNYSDGKENKAASG